MATLTKTRKLIDDLGDQINAASKASFLGVIDSVETMRSSNCGWPQWDLRPQQIHRK
jgi:hypothetical protein